MKKIFVLSVVVLALTGFIGCSDSSSPTGPGLQADINKGTLTEHANLPNKTLISANIEEFLGSLIGSSFSLTDLTNSIGLQKRLAKKTATGMISDNTIVIDTTINGLSGSASVKATIKSKTTMNSDEEMTNATVQNVSIIFNNFSMNDSIFYAGQIVATGNLSMTPTAYISTINAKAAIRFNGMYRGQLTMDMPIAITGNPSDAESDPKITGIVSIAVTSNGSSFTYSEDLSKSSYLSKRKF
jgi:hypothetical protein